MCVVCKNHIKSWSESKKIEIMEYKKFLIKGVSIVCILLGVSACSTDDSNQHVDNPPKEVTMSNVSKNWVAAHFYFHATIDDASKLALMKSLTKVSLKQGVLDAVDQYSGNTWQGTYSLEGSNFTFTSTQGITYSFTVTQLTNNSMVWEPNFDMGVESIEFVLL